MDEIFLKYPPILEEGLRLCLILGLLLPLWFLLGLCHLTAS